MSCTNELLPFALCMVKFIALDFYLSDLPLLELSVLLL